MTGKHSSDSGEYSLKTVLNNDRAQGLCCFETETAFTRATRWPGKHPVTAKPLGDSHCNREVVQTLSACVRAYVRARARVLGPLEQHTVF